MEIYIEYAFLENFFFDGVLLRLALVAAKMKVSRWRVAISAGLGAVFAIVFPLLRLPTALGMLLKLAVGFLLCMIAFKRLKTRKEWGRYALTAVFFFSFSFGFGGALLGVYGQFFSGTVSDREFAIGRMPNIAVFIGFVILAGITLFLVKKLYARRAILRQTYSCNVKSGRKEVRAEGFLDSGNLAVKNGLPVCFISPDLVYDLWGEEVISEGQVRDEMCISTLAGEKNVPLYRAEIEVEGVRSQVYFAPSANMIRRDYKILLNSRIFEGQSGRET